MAGAWLDLARTVARRAERDALPVDGPPSQAGVYLNRLSDLLWTMARWHESLSGPSRASRSIANPEEQQP
jgi:cob(I)alamin adenosyltransferase